MTLQELSDILLPSFPSSVQKDVKTAVRVLAKALHCTDPVSCTLAQFTLPLPSLYRRIETLLIGQGKSSHTIRNMKNHVSRLFRLAEEQHLFSLAPIQLTSQYPLNTKPFRPGAATSRNNGTYLPYADWPSDLQDAFLAFTIWATAPLVHGREASLRKRLRTVQSYRDTFEGYFGFLHHVQHLTTITFDHLFDVTLVSAFVHWHVNEIHHRATGTVHNFLINLLALTRQYRPLPELRAQLATLKKTLPRPTLVYNKEDAWLPLATLEDIGRSLWPQKKPQHLPQGSHQPGLRSAVHAGLALMFRLWVYIPYRQRNMREMRLGDNLHKDVHGKWRVTFHGEQLKVSLKRGRPNTFDMPFPETLTPLLEEYLTTWRPILLAKASQPSTHVFLTQRGTPYQQRVLAQSTSNIVYRYTGKHWHPHIVRSVWATEWIRKTHGDFYTAAIMLNDTLEILIKNYAHLLEEDVAEKAYRLIEERNGQGK